MYASKNIRLFKSPFLEFFSHVHPVIPGLIFVPIISYLLLTTDLLSALALTLNILAGIFIWTLTEYTLHRFLFHYHAQNHLGKRIIYLFHGIHHDDPEDARRLVMPPVASISLSLLFYYFFSITLTLFLGRHLGPLYLKPFFAGFLIGYLCYDYIHFWTHFGHPKSKLAQGLKRYHMLHHFVTPEARFGVSSPLWDYIVGTTAGGLSQKSALSSQTPDLHR